MEAIRDPSDIKWGQDNRFGYLTGKKKKRRNAFPIGMEVRGKTKIWQAKGVCFRSSNTYDIVTKRSILDSYFVYNENTRMETKKLQLIGGALLGLFLLVFSLFFIFSGNLKRKDEVQNDVKPSSNKNSKGYSLQGQFGKNSQKKRELFTPEYARYAALNILGWMDKTRLHNIRLDNPSSNGEFICDGGYAVSENCTSSKQCTTRMVANNVGLISTWAHYKYYEHVERSRPVLTIVENDLKTYANTKKISAIQPITWNFKLIYELWSGQELSTDQKKLAWDVLYRMQHDPLIINPIEKEVGARESMPELLTFETATPYEGELTERDNLYSIFSSEYTYSFLFIRDSKVEKEQPYLNIATELYNQAMRRYIKSNGDSALFNPYYFGIAALDLYRITGNDDFLTTASRLADRHIGNECSNNMTLCASRVYFYHELLKVNAKQEYMQARNELLQKLFTQSFDSEDVAGYRLGKNAFYTEHKELEESLSYELIPNALLVRVLIEL